MKKTLLALIGTYALAMALAFLPLAALLDLIIEEIRGRADGAPGFPYHSRLTYYVRESFAAALRGFDGRN